MSYVHLKKSFNIILSIPYKCNYLSIRFLCKSINVVLIQFISYYNNF